MFFTQKQIQEILESLERNNWMFIARFINPSLVPESVMKVLRRYGFKDNQVLRYPHLAMQFGLLSMYMKNDFVKDMTFDKLKKSILANKYLPLTEEEEHALQFIEQRAFNDVKGLGNRIGQGINNILIEADKKQRHKYEEIIRDTTKKAVAQREAQSFVRSQIGEKTGQWTRDLDRIADYVLHEAYDEGRANVIEKKFGDEALVFKRVHKDACKHCKKAYLKNQNTFEPRIFKLSELRANGSNIGRKMNQSVAVLGPHHPYCRCDVEHVPRGFIWDKKKRAFVPDNKRVNKYDFSNLIKIGKK